MSSHILLIEDEPSIADNVIYSLKLEGFNVHWVSEGQAGLALLTQQAIDLAIIDVGLPDISGFEVCKTIRKTSDLPILFLTARGDEIDRVVGFEIGADDYVVKPFSPRELAVRVKAILRRGRDSTSSTPDSKLAPSLTSEPSPTPKLSSSASPANESPFCIDEQKRSIHFHNTLLDLTSYEYGILRELLKQPERVYSREQLMNAVWSSPEESFERAVDTHIKTVRAKLRAIDASDQSLITHRGVGYSAKISRLPR
ncbi:MAG: two-component system response regulator CreB [Gammaproteobacteria bacterium]|nr:MAG: two-component system response regulator CreB [Gammaproteobacteria bacterium]